MEGSCEGEVDLVREYLELVFLSKYLSLLIFIGIDFIVRFDLLIKASYKQWSFTNCKQN